MPKKTRQYKQKTRAKRREDTDPKQQPRSLVQKLLDQGWGECPYMGVMCPGPPGNRAGPPLKPVSECLGEPDCQKHQQWFRQSLHKRMVLLRLAPRDQIEEYEKEERKEVRIA